MNRCFKISIDNVDPLWSFDLRGGDGQADVSVSNVIAFGQVTFDGGRGRYSLSRFNFLPRYGADISGFEFLNGP